MKSNLFILAILLSGCGSETIVREAPQQEQKPAPIEVTYAPTPTPIAVPTPTPVKVLHFSEIISMRTLEETWSECASLRDTSGHPYRMPIPEELLNYLPTIKDKISEDYYNVGFWTSQINTNKTFAVISMNKGWGSLLSWEAALGICVYESN